MNVTVNKSTFRRRVTQTVFILALSILSPVAGAGEIQSLDSIRDAVKTFVLAESGSSDTVSATVGSLDRRLRLAKCGQALEAFWPPGARTIGNTTAGVRCAGAKPWKIYVSVRIEVFESIVVANRSMGRGDSLEAGDLRLERRSITALTRGYVTDLKRVVGYRLKRAVRPGEVILPGSLEAEKLIKRGQRVTLLARTGGFEVRMAGTAMRDGAAGERIRVRNLSSRRIVEGQVMPDGIVVVSW